MVRLIGNVLKFILKQILSGLKFAFPYAMRLFWFTFIASLRLSLLGIASMARGVPQAAMMVAEDWKVRAVNAGFPYLWETHLFNIFYVLALCTIFAGWAVLLFIVVFTIDLAYRLIF